MSIKRSPFGPFAVLAMLTAVVMVLTNNAKADDTPSPEDLANLADIQANQRVLAETRESYEKFLLFKSYNEAEVAELARNGWCVKFDKDPDNVTLGRCPLL